MSDEYAEWRHLLSLPRIDGYMDEPMAGFWRVRFGSDNGYVPFATFWQDGELLALRLGESSSPYEHWPRYAYRPITESIYRAVAEQGTVAQTQRICWRGLRDTTSQSPIAAARYG